MGAILVWGKCRELLSGDLPTGVTAVEVQSLAELQAKLETGTGALVLADGARVEAERAALEPWLKSGGRERVVLLVGAEAAQIDEILQRCPFVDDAYVKPISAVRLRHRVLRGMDLINERRALLQLE